MKKRIQLMLMLAAAASIIAGCSTTAQQASSSTGTESSTTSSVLEPAQDEESATESSSAPEASSSEDTSEPEESASAPQETSEEASSEAGETAVSEEAPAQEGEYTDNFSVSQEDAAAFAARIQEAVSQKDLEGLADLAAFPFYIGFEDGGVDVETREDFLAYSADDIFTSELTESIANADTSALNPSMAGFALSQGNGAPNIIFGVRDGSLAISGINY